MDFQHFGNILSCQVMKASASDSEVFGVVNFSQKNAVRCAILGMDGFVADAATQTKLSVNPMVGEETFVEPFSDVYPPPGVFHTPAPAGDRGCAPPGASVHVSDVPKTWSNEDLFRHFTHYGGIAGVRVIVMEDGQSRGFGFVSYVHPASAQRALIGMHGFLTEAGG